MTHTFELKPSHAHGVGATAVEAIQTGIPHVRTDTRGGCVVKYAHALAHAHTCNRMRSMVSMYVLCAGMQCQDNWFRCGATCHIKCSASHHCVKILPILPCSFQIDTESTGICRSFGACRKCNWVNMLALPAAWIGLPRL